MDKKQVIETLKMENDLICFNPLTGEEIPLEYVNDLNRSCYDAHQEAIRLINNSIPVEWIEEWQNRHEWKYDSYFTMRDGKPKYAIECMIEDWEKENETNR